MNVSLSPQLESYVKQKVAAGMYNSVSDVMREALRLLEECDAMRETKLEELRRDIQQGIDSLDQGQGSPLDMEAIKKKARALKTEQMTAPNTMCLTCISEISGSPESIKP